MQLLLTITGTGLVRLVVACVLLSCAQSEPSPLPAADANAVLPAADAEPACTADVATTYYADDDGDGFGNPDFITVVCALPQGFVENDSDCNDADSRIHPGSPELCDGIDNDCAPDTIEACPTGCVPTLRNADSYLFCSNLLTQDAAAAACAVEGMTLVSITDQDEQSWVTEQRNLAFGGSLETWMGATDAVTEGDWAWADGTSFWTGSSNGMTVDNQYSFWRASSSEPSNEGDCAVLDNGNPGDWHDLVCNAVRTYICERSPISP